MLPNLLAVEPAFSALSPPVLDVATTPEVITAVATILVALIGVLATALRWLNAAINKRINDLSVQTEQAVNAARVAADEAHGAHAGVTNSHGTHLRDDVDNLQASVNTVLQRLDSTEKAREVRARRAENQIDGLREDVRAVAGRMDRELERVNSRIDTINAPATTP